MATRPALTLYGRAGCHLCEEMHGGRELCRHRLEPEAVTAYLAKIS